MRRLIVNGATIRANDAPFVVRIHCVDSDDVGVCAGTLVGQQHVLTAAHCFENCPQVSVKTFTTSLSGSVAQTCSDRVRASGITAHPAYTKSSVLNDALVLTLERVPLCWDQVPGPRAVYLDNGTFWPSTSNRPLLLSLAQVAGWGRDRDAAYTDIISRATVRLLTPGYCSYQHVSLGCSASFDGSSPCSGDSGGPLYVRHRGVDVLVGVVSFGTPNCSGQTYYAKVAGLHSLVTAHVPDATFVDADERRPDELACECTTSATGCLSGSTNVSPACGCMQYGICYTIRPYDCTTAVASYRFPGAGYRSCIAPPFAPSSVPAPPPLPAQAPPRASASPPHVPPSPPLNSTHLHTPDLFLWRMSVSVSIGIGLFYALSLVLILHFVYDLAMRRRVSR